MPFYMKKVFNLVSEIYLYRVNKWLKIEPE